MLCVGHVHRYAPGEDDDPGELPPIEASLVAWRKRGRGDGSDRAFLAACRAAYLASAPSWDYWRRNYEPLLREARVPIEEVAFTNVAKCRTATTDDSSASVRLARVCTSVYSPADLVNILRPAAVLLASLRLEIGEVTGAQLIRWNGRTGVDDNGYTMKNWLKIEGARLHRLRGRNS